MVFGETDLLITFNLFSDKKTVDMLDQGMSSEFTPPMIKRSRLSPPPLSERVMLYVRQEAEDVYTPLHVVPPTTQGLLNAVSSFALLLYNVDLKWFIKMLGLLTNICVVHNIFHNINNTLYSK